MRSKQPDFIVIGIIVKAHGTGGEVKVKPLTDYPPRFKQLEFVYVELQSQEVLHLEISKVVVQNNLILLGFKEITDRNQAESLIGAYLTLKREDILPIGKDAFYHFEVIGFLVKTLNGQIVGRIEEVLDLTSNDVLVVKNENKEFLIPVIKDVIKKIDREREEILIDPIEGLLN